MQEQKLFKVTSWCCCHLGACKINLVLDKNAYAAGETAVVTA